MDTAQLKEFAAKYTAAWSSQNAASVAAFYAERGSLQINEATPSVGRTAITEVAQGFMTAFHFDEAEYQRQLKAGIGGG